MQQSEYVQELRAEGVAIGKAEGVAIGKAEGIAETHRSNLMKLLQLRHGPAAAEFVPLIEKQVDLAVLGRWFNAAAVANSLDEIRAAFTPLS